MNDDGLGARLARNIKELRTARGSTQQQMAKLSELPRATWANLESGDANPTLQVLHRVAVALQIQLEELVAPERSDGRLYPRGSLPSRRRGNVTVQSLLPDKVPGVVIERMDIPARARLVGIPHTRGTREYLTCEAGDIELVASGRSFHLTTGDVVSFAGDQRHSYFNPGSKGAVGYSVVMLEPVE
jgi:transcriptional regulator with XRE-family HTH domain